jgi:hypothetical protein
LYEGSRVSGTVQVDIGGAALAIRTQLPEERVRSIEHRIRETLEGIRQGRDLPERELFALGLLTLTDEVLDAEARLVQHEEAAKRLEALIRRTESAL